MKFSLRAIERFFIIACAITVEVTTEWGKDAFFVHTIFVTAALLSETIALRGMYGRVAMPRRLHQFTNLVVAGGVMHNLNPVLMAVYHEDAVYVHLPVCFSVHVLHMLHVVLVFRDCKVWDNTHIGVLLFVNVIEMVTNLAVLDEDLYPHVARVCEVCTLLIWTVSTKSSNQKARTSVVNRKPSSRVNVTPAHSAQNSKIHISDISEATTSQDP